MDPFASVSKLHNVEINIVNLIHIHIQDNVMVEEVKLRRKYLNSGDVFILDLGLDLIQVCE